MIGRRPLLVGLAASPLLAGIARADTMVLRAGDQKGGAQSVMQAAGVLGDLPYRLEWSQFAAAAPVLEALNAGAVDCSVAGDAPSTFALAAGLPGRVVSAIRTTGAGTAILVGQNSPIRNVADLKGRIVATNRGSIGHALVLAVIEAQGWKPSDITIANLLPSSAKSALAAGAVDAWCSWGVYIAEAQLADHARVVVDGRNGLMSGLSYLVGSDAAIAQKHAALLDFCRRLAAARRWANGHRDEYAGVLAGEIGVSHAVARLVFETELPVPTVIDAAVIADEQKTADSFLAAGVLRRRLDAAGIFDTSFNQALS